MNDTRFRWLLIVAALTVIITAAIWKYPEIVKAQELKDVKMGEYVYLDAIGKIHCNRKCSKLNYKGLTSERVKVDEIQNMKMNDITFCPHCVSDKDYDLLNKSISR